MLPQDFQEVVQHYVSLFHEKDCYFDDDHKRLAYFCKNPLNEDVSEIIVKISTMEHNQIDDLLCSRRVMAEHIAALHIDAVLQQGLPEVVNSMARLETRHQSYFLYSFASQYCNWHNRSAYPIYDPTIHRLLTFYWQECNHSILLNDDFYDYSRFQGRVTEFRKQVGMEKYDFKELDKFVWIYGNSIVQDALLLNRSVLHG